MTLTITGRLIRSTLTRHTAAAGEHGWEVTWLPGRALTRDQALAAMHLAELTGVYNEHPIGRHDDPRWEQADTWAAELGLSGPNAIARSSESPEDIAARAGSLATRLIPDLDGELTAALTQVEELLMGVAASQDDDPGTSWPAPLAGGHALAAVRRVWDAVAPTQGEHATEAGLTGRILAPDGKYEHVPLRLAAVDPADVAALAATAVLFGDPHAPGYVREALEHGADAAFGSGEDEAGTRLVMTIAQLAGLLDLAADRDSELLAALLDEDDPGADVVLSPDAEAAYQRYAARVNRMWQLGDPLHRWQY